MTWNSAEIDRHWLETLDMVSSETGLERWRIEEAFAYGACAQLALAVADHRGLSLAIVEGSGGYLHAFCVVSDGLGLDIWGVRSFGTILEVWQEDDPACSIRPVSAEALASMGVRAASPEFSDIPMRMAREGCLAGVVLDEFTVVEFNCGACGDLAAVLHDRTGWPIMAELDAEGDVEHIWVVDDDGRAIDINGIHPDGRAVTPYSSPGSGRIVPMSRAEASGAGRHCVENREWAMALVARYPENFGFHVPGDRTSVRQQERKPTC